MSNESRREFCIRMGLGAGVAATAAQGAFALRSVIPNVTYDAPTTVKLGLPDEFPDGVKYLPDQRLFIFRDDKTFHAIAAVCTHLGCTVRVAAEPAETRTFVCPCHGSAYAKNGAPVSGPAPAPLPWYELTLSPDDGQLLVDLGRPATAGTRLSLA